jgi:hypothetical protein
MRAIASKHKCLLLVDSELWLSQQGLYVGRKQAGDLKVPRMVDRKTRGQESHSRRMTRPRAVCEVLAWVLIGEEDVGFRCQRSQTYEDVTDEAVHFTAFPIAAACIRSDGDRARSRQQF